jgi:GntR family transcriptional regulator
MTTHAITPHTRIENSFIDEVAAKIGIYGLGIYVAIKRHFNQKTGECFPSYQTLARKLHIDRSTVIRYVKKMRDLQIISPEWRFKEDGSHTSNQYHFPGRENCGSAKNSAHPVHAGEGSSTKPPPVVAEDNHPGCTEPPEQSPLLNKKQRTIDEVDLMPTEKQKTCTHPPELIVILPDNITICNHCYGLLDENLKLVEEKKAPDAKAA